MSGTTRIRNKNMKGTWSVVKRFNSHVSGVWFGAGRENETKQEEIKKKIPKDERHQNADQKAFKPQKGKIQRINITGTPE